MDEDLYKKAVDCILSGGKASVQNIKKCLKTDYNTAADIIERMQEEKIISEPDKKGNRQILVPLIEKEKNIETPKEKKQRFYDKHPYLFYAAFAIFFIVVFYEPVSKNAAHNNKIKKEAPIEQKKELLSHYEMEKRCKSYIKSQLKFPATFKSGIFDTSSMQKSDELFAVQVSYEAKNGFGVEIEGLAYCEFKNGELSFFELGLQ